MAAAAPRRRRRLTDEAGRAADAAVAEGACAAVATLPPSVRPVQCRPPRRLSVCRTEESDAPRRPRDAGHRNATSDGHRYSLTTLPLARELCNKSVSFLSTVFYYFSLSFTVSLFVLIYMSSTVAMSSVLSSCVTSRLSFRRPHVCAPCCD